MLRDLVARWSSSDEDLEAQELQAASRSHGSTAVADCRAGEIARVEGVVRSVTIEPTSGLPSLEAVVFDGTGSVALVWLGRRRIVGIEPGRRLQAIGRVTARSTEPVLYNPRYELLPGRHS